MKSGVFVAALWTLTQFRSRWRGVERVATDTVETPFASLQLEAPVIPAIVVKPQTQKNRSDEKAEKDSPGGELKHPEPSIGSESRAPSACSLSR